MPNRPRPVSDTGYYHLTLRGNGKQIIFEERADYIHFLYNLKQYSAENKITINAFCLMENHVHLLVFDKEHNLSMFMKRLAGNYALWFNKKYDRVGHLFQGRYSCRLIESDDALCTVFRYILCNPAKAGICAPEEYQWSSYGRYGDTRSFVDTKILVELLGSFEEYAAYINAKHEDAEDPEFQNPVRDDEWARTVMKETLNIENGSVLRSLDKRSRNEALRTLREKGLSIRQIERLTGISKSIIQRISGQ